MKETPLWFFVQMENRVVPLEIKSGTMASLKSLRKASHKVTIEIESRIADFTLINLPLYMISQAERIVNKLRITRRGKYKHGKKERSNDQ